MPANDAIGNRAFMTRVKEVLSLREFIVREGGDVLSGRVGDLDCDGLYALQRARLLGRGRQPTPQEWNLVEEKFISFNQMLVQEQRRKFILRQYPTLVLYVAIFSLAISLVALNVAVYPDHLTEFLHKVGAPIFGAKYQPSEGSILLLDFILWNICLGALGSIAFISVNALSMQADATLDITNKKFVILRIILGALFGILIALPVGYVEFAYFCHAVANLDAQSSPVSGSSAPSNIISAGQALYLLLPFLVGFSTSLFLTIISKFISGVQSLFGVEGPSRPTDRQQSAIGIFSPKSMLG